MTLDNGKLHFCNDRTLARFLEVHDASECGQVLLSKMFLWRVVFCSHRSFEDKFRAELLLLCSPLEQPLCSPTPPSIFALLTCCNLLQTTLEQNLNFDPACASYGMDKVPPGAWVLVCP